MSNQSYQPPVSQLLTYGNCNEMNSNQWPNYVQELGFGEEHISELIRIATDQSFFGTDEEDRLEVWASVHAWRTLAQLKAEAAIEGLTPLFTIDDDWILEELPKVYALIGPAALPKLTTHLANTQYEDYVRVIAIDALEEMGKIYPDSRDQCVAILTKQLRKFTEQDRDFNGILVAALLGLNAVESATVIERAFAADRVEPFMAGDWSDVQVELGLKTKEEVPQEREYLTDFNSLIQSRLSETPLTAKSRSGKANPKTKAKNKQAQASRKKNRKKRK